MKVTLTVVKGPGQGRCVEFRQPRNYMIGRARDMDFVLPEEDRYVSRRHVMIEVAPPNARVVDLARTNPPHLNGEPVSTAELRDGDLLELGYTVFRIGMDQSIATREGYCRACGAGVTLLEDEDEPTQCISCPPMDRPKPAAAERQFACDCCGRDLTIKARSDGRDAELAGEVIYRCDSDKCLPRYDAAAGRRFGPYRAIRRLGVGGMGEVLLIYHADTARLLALKHVADLKNEQLVKRFIERDTRFTAELRHPSLVRYVDRGIGEDGAPYLVMQYLPDGSLDALIQPGTPLMAPDEAVAIVASALEGLIHMHARKIIHRDIKPANILLDRRRRGGAGFAKLADFGLAVCYANAGGTRLTSHGARMGTPMFMSPEQARNSASVREAADTYSMGVTLYYLLTGRYSLNFPSPSEIAQNVAAGIARWKALDPRDLDPRILAELGCECALNTILDLGVTPIPVRQRRPELPAKLAGIIDRAVRKSVNERFVAAADMRDALFAAMR